MSDQPIPPSYEDPEFWHKVLVEGEKPVKFIRSVFRRVPGAPRCKFCFAPFANIGGRVLSLTGFAPSRKNPTFCNS
jgi:adenylate cyclase